MYLGIASLFAEKGNAIITRIRSLDCINFLQSLYHTTKRISIDLRGIMKFSLWLCSFFLLSSSLFGTSQLQWETDYKKALERGVKEEKSLLLFFNGSDWSGWGMKMKKEILDDLDFAEEVDKFFVCVELDFPIHKKLSPDLVNQNLRLKELLEVNDYPRIVLIDTNQRQIARYGYLQESAKVFGHELVQVLQKDQQLCEFLAKIKNSSYTSKTLENHYRLALELQRKDDAQAILDIGCQSEHPVFFLLEKYRLLAENRGIDSEEAKTIREKLVILDPKNEKGVHFTLALIDFQECASRKLEPHEIVAPLEAYLAKFGDSDSENTWRIEMMLAQFYLDCDQFSTALQHAETAYRAAPPEMQKEIAHSVEYIKKNGQI